jgi:diacylglycerol kinase family enzyme
MRERPKIAVIVNPAAHKGGAGKRWPAIQAELVRRLGSFEPLLTQAPGHATHLARAALAEGARRFVTVGGDGTVNETLNGLLETSGRLSAPDTVLCLVPAGTANELCRALGHLDHPARAFDAAAGEGTRPSICCACAAAGSTAGRSIASVISSYRWARPPPSATAPRSRAG